MHVLMLYENFNANANKSIFSFVCQNWVEKILVISLVN